MTLQLNTLGDGDSREAWRAALVEHFAGVRGELSEELQERLDKNPLRILDSKEPRDKAHVAGAPQIDQFLSAEAQEFFDAVTSGLDAAGVGWTRKTWCAGSTITATRRSSYSDEGSAAADRLGAQGTVLGGGRYDGLMESLGGPVTPAVGWAAGIERLAMLVGERERLGDAVALLPISKHQFPLVCELAALFRSEGLEIETAPRFQNSSKLFDKFKKAGIPFVLDIASPDVDGVVAHLRLLFGHAPKEIVQFLSEQIEAVLETAFEIRYAGGKPRMSTGWDLVRRRQ